MLIKIYHLKESNGGKKESFIYRQTNDVPSQRIGALFKISKFIPSLHLWRLFHHMARSEKKYKHYIIRKGH